MGRSDPQSEQAHGSLVELTPERWQQMKSLFCAALERSPEERGRFLQQACGSDESLRAEVESLLNEQLAVATSDVSGAPSVLQSPPALEGVMVGRRLGAYEIVRRLATGGMATVYLAERADARYRKQVAIKLLTSGLDNPEIMRRFGNERQTLAALDHPNIVKLLDGGATPDGIPYLVMDHVEGVSIEEYCDIHKLSISERLGLFRTLCAAVEYAHQKGVIHRDLKPSNIMVTANGAVRLLDFGIAKVLNPELSLGTLQLTQTGLRQLTPAYASPEQIRGEPMTSTSDVYSLGVMLYELLTGHHPYQLKRHTPIELERAICETDPEKPSAVVSRLDEETAPNVSGRCLVTPESVSRTREGEPQKLQRRLRGDLDNIVLMALQKEPQRRYGSVQELSSDILRHLEHRPIKARQGTLTYRASKFTRRHRMEALAALAGAVLVAAVQAGVASNLRRWLSAGTSPVIHSVAVLPLQNLSGDPAQEYFAAGMTDELITELSGISALKVISSKSVMRYRRSDKSLPEIGRELNVDAIVAGSVARSGNYVRVNAQLVSAPEDKNVWAQSYERELRDSLALQSELASAIAGAVRAQVTPGEQARLRTARSVNPEALEAYLQGNYHFGKYGSGSGLDETEKALQCFRQAIAESPSFARAYEAMAGVYEEQRLVSAPQGRAIPLLRAAAEKALALDPRLSSAHMFLGDAKSGYEWDWSGAEREYRQAIELNPSNAWAHETYGEFLMSMGKVEEGLNAQQRAQELDPRSDRMGQGLYKARRYDRAVDLLSKFVEQPRAGTSRFWLSESYAEKGMYQEAIRQLRSVLVLFGLREAADSMDRGYAATSYKRGMLEAARHLELLYANKQMNPGWIARFYARAGDNEQAIRWLERDYGERADNLLVELNVDPVWDPLRSDPRFKGLVHRIGLPQ